MTAPSGVDPKMWEEWMEFKKTAFFVNIMASIGPDMEGPAWGLFYKGYQAGEKKNVRQ